MPQFIMGALAMAFAVVGLFFWRFWCKTGDRLFAIFALSFWLLGLIRVGLAYFGQSSEDQEATSFLYLVRLLAFVLILLAIVDKNRALKKTDRQ